MNLTLQQCARAVRVTFSNVNSSFIKIIMYVLAVHYSSTNIFAKQISTHTYSTHALKYTQDNKYTNTVYEDFFFSH